MPTHVIQLVEDDVRTLEVSHFQNGIIFFSLHQFFALISATSAFIFGPCVYSFALFAFILSF
jgi:hypothetical protein